MSIKTHLRITQQLEQMIAKLQKKYSHHAGAALELNKLQSSVKQLETYLNNLDALQPNYSTNEINSYIEAINLHLDILKGELENKDYIKLQQGIRAVRKILNFHPTKYSFFTFIIAWIYEMIYFI